MWCVSKMFQKPTMIKKTGAPLGTPVLSLWMQKRSFQVIALIRKRISRKANNSAPKGGPVSVLAYSLQFTITCSEQKNARY